MLVLLVLGVHLSGLFLAFGMVNGDTPAETLPVLSVRVLELAPVRAKVEESRTVEPPKTAKALEPPAVVAPPEPVKAPRKVRQQKPARVVPAPAKKLSPTPPALLTAALAATAASSFVVAPPAASPAVASPLALAAPLPVVGARFDADYLRNPPPVYPAASRRIGEEGRVVLRVMVSAEGLPLSVEIKQASGFRRLDEAARAAVERWRFVPARRGATAIESSVLVPLQFTLKG